MLLNFYIKDFTAVFIETLMRYSTIVAGTLSSILSL